MWRQSGRIAGMLAQMEGKKCGLYDFWRMYMPMNPASSEYSHLCEAAFSSDTQQAINLSAAPRSLEYTRHSEQVLQTTNPSLLQKALLRFGGYYSKESTLMRAANGLYSSITETATNRELLSVLDIPLEDFQHQHAMLCLHVWMLLARLRPEGPDGKRLAQMMYDDFQEDVETRVRAAGVQVRVGKQLAELEKQFYGSCLAYDRALKGEDGAEKLSLALLRNVYQANKKKQPAAAQLERYARREMACLAMTDSTAVLAGNLRFSFALDRL